MRIFRILWKGELYEMSAVTTDSLKPSIGGELWQAPNPLPDEAQWLASEVINSIWETLPDDRNTAIDLAKWQDWLDQQASA